MSGVAKTALLVAIAFLAGVLCKQHFGADARILADMKQEMRMLADMKQEIVDMRQAQQAIEEKVGMTEHTDMNATARRLNHILIASGTMATGIGCFQVTADTTLDMSAQDCSSKYCPDCFYSTASSAITLTISNCHTSKWTQSGLEMGSDDLSTALRKYTFINLATSPANRMLVTDGTNGFMVLAKNHMTAWCYTGVSNTLHYPYNPSAYALSACPTACDSLIPTRPSGDAFSNIVNHASTLTCGSSITNDGTSSTSLSSVCVESR
jgi:hypothetical protein